MQWKCCLMNKQRDNTVLGDDNFLHPPGFKHLTSLNHWTSNFIWERISIYFFCLVHMKNGHAWPTLEPICARNTCNQRTESPAIFWALSNLSRSSWFTTTFKAPQWNGMPKKHPILWIVSNHIISHVFCQTPHPHRKQYLWSRCNHLIERCHPLFQQHLCFWLSLPLHPQLSFPMLLE